MVIYDNLENRIGCNVGFHRRVQEKSISDLSAGSGLTVEKIKGIEDFSVKTVTSAEVKALADALKIRQERLLDACPQLDQSEHVDECKAKRVFGMVIGAYPGDTRPRFSGSAKAKRDLGRDLGRRLKEKSR